MSTNAVSEQEKNVIAPTVNAQTGITVTLKNQTINIPLDKVTYETVATFFDVRGKEIFLFNTNGKQKNKLLNIGDALNGAIEDGDTVRIVAKAMRYSSTGTVISTNAPIGDTKKGVSITLKDRKKILPVFCINYETLAALFDVYGKQIYLYNKTKNVLVKVEDAQNGLISDGDECRVVAKKYPEKLSDTTSKLPVINSETVDCKQKEKKIKCNMTNNNDIDLEAEIMFEKHLELELDVPQTTSWLYKYITQTPMFCNKCRCMVCCYSFISKYGFGKTKCKTCHRPVTENYIATLIRKYIETFGFDDSFLKESTTFFEHLSIFDYL